MKVSTSEKIFKCPFGKDDCICNINIRTREHTDYCCALNNFNFADGECHFYKKGSVEERIEIERDIIAYETLHK